MPQSRERQYYKRYVDQAINDIERAMGRAIELKLLLAKHYMDDYDSSEEIPIKIDMILGEHYPKQLEALDATLLTLESAIEVFKFIRQM